MRRVACSLKGRGLVVDAERLHRILRRITADLDVLARYRAQGVASVLADEEALGYVK